MSDPYRTPPGAAVDVKVVSMGSQNDLEHVEKRLASLLREGYQLVAHSGNHNEYGTYRALWTLVKVEVDS